MASPGVARAVILMGGGTVEIEGSEEFVANQLSRLQLDSQDKPHQTSIFSEPSLSNAIEPGRRAAKAIGKYEKLYGVVPGGEIALLKALPGSNMKHKTVSAALLVSYANSLLGMEHTPLEVIRKACKEQACHDTNNFSATLKRESELFEHSGATYIRLTEAGRTLAKNLAEKLISDVK